MSGSVRVLLLARDEALAGPLALGLDTLGWRTVTARGVHTAAMVMEDFPVEVAIVVDAESAKASEAAEKLRSLRWGGGLLIVGVTGAPVDAAPDPTHCVTPTAAGFDLTLGLACHPVQLALRLEQLMRATAAEGEFALRRLTFSEHGAWLPAAEPDSAPFRVLTVGEPAPKFLALSHALQALGAEVTGAFTAYTAFDYLHERRFDAVVLWGGAMQGEALAIAAGMRRNSRLYHLPTVLYLRSTAEIDISGAYRRGVTDVATADTPEPETAQRTVALATTFRRDGAIRRALERVRDDGLMEPATGLFTPQMFAAHLIRLAEVTAARRRPLSLAVLRVAGSAETLRARSGGWLDVALPQVGAMVARLVRAEDTAARINPEIFALALPGAGLEAARRAAERIAAVIACTAFPMAEGERPFVIDFECGAAERAPGESAADALNRAAGALEMRRAG